MTGKREDAEGVGKFIVEKENPEPRSVSHPRDSVSPPAPEFPISYK